MDDSISSHRTRTNRRPQPVPLDAPPALAAAVDDIFKQPIEDKS